MSQTPSKPKHTRRQLLAHVAQIQNQLGMVEEYLRNDRDPDRLQHVALALKRAQNLCIKATSTDRPVTDTEMRYLGFRIESCGKKEQS